MVVGRRGEVDHRVADNDLAEVERHARRHHRVHGLGPDLVDPREHAPPEVLGRRDRDPHPRRGHRRVEADGALHRAVAGDGGDLPPVRVHPGVHSEVGGDAVRVGHHGQARQRERIGRRHRQGVGEGALGVVVPERVEVGVDGVLRVVRARLAVPSIVAGVRGGAFRGGSVGPARWRGRLGAAQDGDLAAGFEEGVGTRHVTGGPDDPYRSHRTAGRRLDVAVPGRIRDRSGGRSLNRRRSRGRSRAQEGQPGRGQHRPAHTRSEHGAPVGPLCCLHFIRHVCVPPSARTGTGQE